MDSEINCFRGKYSFLSNFFTSAFVYKGHVYATAEHAFQAAKCSRFDEAKMIRESKTAQMAKIKGRSIKMRMDWETVKDSVMDEILREKFKNQTLKQMLLNTNSAKLIEGNTWHDLHWGICKCAKCNGKGKNVLGETLMCIRADLKKNGSK